LMIRDECVVMIHKAERNIDLDRNEQNVWALNFQHMKQKAKQRYRAQQPINWLPKEKTVRNILSPDRRHFFWG
jgi:hypothetical protein